MDTIQKIEIANFKAFENSIVLPIDGKNSLVFGENGSGKTSLYEAFKVSFFDEKIKKKTVSSSTTPEDEKEILAKLYDSYNNAKNKGKFSIKINGVECGSLPRDNYNVFLLTHSDFELQNDCIKLVSTLEDLFFDYGDASISTLLNEIADELEADVNKALEEQFSETVKISIDKGDSYRCIINDSQSQLEYGTNLSHYFNEGKIHLVLIVLYLNIVARLANNDKHTILVLDDFVTSLDATNRAFILRYIFSKFENIKSLQLLVMTHNVSFYNLTKHYINNYLPKGSQQNWAYFNLYNLGDFHKLYPQYDDSIEKVENDFKSGTFPLEDLGNRIRQLFEIQVHELAKIIVTGGIEESKDILSRMTNDKPVYFKNEKGIFELVENLEKLAQIDAIDKTTLSKKIIDAINEFKKDTDLSNLRKLLKNMTLFQKVSLHPTSHGCLGLTPVSEKELKESIVLVRKISSSLGTLKEKDVTNF